MLSSVGLFLMTLKTNAIQINRLYYICVNLDACPGVGQIYSVDCYPTDASCDNPDPHADCDAGRCVCPRGKVLDHSTNPPRCVYTSDCRKD